MSEERSPSSDGLAAALVRCGVVDATGFARLVATGPDILDLLHRLGTGDVKTLTLGQGQPTVLTNAKGRIVERGPGQDVLQRPQHAYTRTLLAAVPRLTLGA